MRTDQWCCLKRENILSSPSNMSPTYLQHISNISPTYLQHIFNVSIYFKAVPRAAGARQRGSTRTTARQHSSKHYEECQVSSHSHRRQGCHRDVLPVTGAAVRSCGAYERTQIRMVAATDVRKQTPSALQVQYIICATSSLRIKTIYLRRPSHRAIPNAAVRTTRQSKPTPQRHRNPAIRGRQFLRLHRLSSALLLLPLPPLHLPLPPSTGGSSIHSQHPQALPMVQVQLQLQLASRPLIIGTG
jgi:hypothetical protein